MLKLSFVCISVVWQVTAMCLDPLSIWQLGEVRRIILAFGSSVWLSKAYIRELWGLNQGMWTVDCARSINTKCGPLFHHGHV